MLKINKLLFEERSCIADKQLDGGSFHHRMIDDLFSRYL